MDTLRIFHCADFHIGMRFSDYASSDALREARLSAVDRVVEAARAADCHLLSVSGDLFDRVSMTKADVSRAAAALSDFPGRAVLVLPGNHDYAGAESTLWRDFRDSAADHVHVLDRSEPFDLAGYDIPAVVYPAPCDAKHSSDNRIGYVSAALSDRAGDGATDADGRRATTGSSRPADGTSAPGIPGNAGTGPPAGSSRPAAGGHSGPAAGNPRPWRIGMAHGSIEGVSPDFDGRYFPMRRSELEEARVDVWLLGHSHVSWPESLADSPRILNPGTPEPDGFDCGHPGHAFIVELGAPGGGRAHGERTSDGPAAGARAPVSVERVTTGLFRFRREQRTLNSSADVEALKDIINDGSAASTILRLELDGRLDPQALAALEHAVEALRGRVAELDVRHENVGEAVTRERIAEEYPEGSFASTLLLSFSDEDDRDALEMAWDIVEESRQ